MRQGVRRAGGALVSGMFLASAFADETGVDPGGVVGFGLNTLACVAVGICAAVGKAGDSGGLLRAQQYRHGTSRPGKRPSSAGLRPVRCAAAISGEERR